MAHWYVQYFFKDLKGSSFGVKSCVIRGDSRLAARLRLIEIFEGSRYEVMFLMGQPALDIQIRTMKEPALDQ